MAFFIDEERKFVVYESPKTGGTTLRSWINFAGTGQLAVSGTKDYYYERADVYSSLDDWGYNYSRFTELEGYEKVCIKREPISRFISCYTDKIVRENHIPNCDLGDFIDTFDDTLRDHPMKHPSLPGKDIGYLWYHFVPQTYHLGTDKSYYDLVVDTKELSTVLKPYLESKWGVELPDIHTRKQTLEKPSLSVKQLEQVRRIYHPDFRAGWA